MRSSTRLLLSVAVLLVPTAFAIADAMDPLTTGIAEAQQVEPTQVVESAAPPNAPTGELTAVREGEALLDAAPTVPGTPLAPTPSDSTNRGSIETGDGLTTNLGGSDVAVSSVGGSHEVDGPKRKAKRVPTPRPQP